MPDPAPAHAPVSDGETEVRAIEVRGLVRAFGAARAVDGLDLVVRRGECLGLLGPNGAGKTTTLRVLSTTLAPTEGEVRVLGLDPQRDGAAVRARIGAVPQEIALYETLSARENLAFFARTFGVAADRIGERVGESLGLAGLVDRADDRVGSFSGGMQRRLNLVAGLLHDPELLFLDEPTVGIDPQSRGRVLELVRDLAAAGKTVVYTTHQLGEVERLCDRIVILDRGRAVAQGTLEELQREVGASGPTGGLELAPGTDLDHVVEVLRGRGIEARLREQAPDLEEVFLALTGRALRDED